MPERQEERGGGLGSRRREVLCCNAVADAGFDAADLGHTVVVPADAIAGVPADCTPAMIRHTLALVSIIATTDEVLSCWKRPRRVTPG